MGTPSWQPLPYFDPEAAEPSFSDRAKARASHRAIMAMRWRNQEARAEDRKLGRLPYDWHDWMLCPQDTYGASGCACDAGQGKGQHPVVLRQIERERRAKQSAMGARTAQNACVQWVQSIDTPSRAPTILDYAQAPPCPDHAYIRTEVGEGASPTTQDGHIRGNGSAKASSSGGRWKVRPQKRERHLSVTDRRLARRRWVHQQARIGFGRFLSRLFWVRSGSKSLA